MADIFISYSHHDRALAADLAGFLGSCGYDVWWDYELVGGTKFRKEIKAQLDAAKAAIVIWSEHSVESEYVLDEAEDAKSQNKLLPVRSPALEFKKIPFGFRQLQTDIVTKPDLILRSLDEFKVTPSRPPEPKVEPVVMGAQGVDPGNVAEARQFAAWEFIKDSQEPAKFREFITAYAGSPLAELAQARLRKLAEVHWPRVQATSDPKVLRQFIADFPASEAEGLARRNLMGLEGKAWYGITDKADPRKLSEFLADFPDGPFAIEARHLLSTLKSSELEKNAWAEIMVHPNKEKLEGFLAAFPLGANAEKARTLLATAIKSETRARRWAEIKGTAYLEQIRTFLLDYDEGPEVQEARALLAERLAEREEAAWAEVANSRHPTSILHFMAGFPDGRRVGDALKLLQALPASVMSEVDQIVKQSRNPTLAEAASVWVEAQRAALPPLETAKATARGPGKPQAATEGQRLEASTPDATVKAATGPSFGRRWKIVVGMLLFVAAIGGLAAINSMANFQTWNRWSTAWSTAISVAVFTAALTVALAVYLWRVYAGLKGQALTLRTMAVKHAFALGGILVLMAALLEVGRMNHRALNISGSSIDNVHPAAIEQLFLLGLAVVHLALGWLMRRGVRATIVVYAIMITLLAVICASFATTSGRTLVPNDYFLTWTVDWYGSILYVAAWAMLALLYVKCRKSGGLRGQEPSKAAPAGDAVASAGAQP